ncbi:MAG: endolytic transglycosylase MltG, partial [Brachymonas sp.]
MPISQARPSHGISLLTVVVVLALLAALGAGAVYRWAQQPLSLTLPAGEDSVDLVIPSGAGANAIAKAIQEASQGAAPEWLLVLWLRATGKAGELKAGSYEIVQGDSPRSLIDKIISGKQSLRSVTLIEGWNWRQVRVALAKAPHLKNDSTKLSDIELMARLGRNTLPEGRFFFQDVPGTTDPAQLVNVIPLVRRRNTFRMEPYHRFDIGLVYKLNPRRGEADLSFSIYNAYNRMNPFFIYFETVT